MLRQHYEDTEQKQLKYQLQWMSNCMDISQANSRIAARPNSTKRLMMVMMMVVVMVMVMMLMIMISEEEDDDVVGHDGGYDGDGDG